MLLSPMRATPPFRGPPTPPDSVYDEPLSPVDFTAVDIHHRTNEYGAIDGPVSHPHDPTIQKHPIDLESPPSPYPVPYLTPPSPVRSLPVPNPPSQSQPTFPPFRRARSPAPQHRLRPSHISQPSLSKMPRQSYLTNFRRRIALFFQHTKFFHSQPFWLGMYFLFNLCLTLYNKGVLVRFPFPATLTALHALCGSIGGYLLLEGGFFVPARLTVRENITLVLFSTLYTVNIAVSNISLQLVTVPFHQVVRAATPIFIIGISSFFLQTRYTSTKLSTLVPLMAGVGFATYGDYYFTAWGLTLTLFGTLLAAFKTVLTNVLQSPSPVAAPAPSRRSPSPSRSNPSALAPRPPVPWRLQLHPLDILARMSPLAFVQCVAYAAWSGELDRVRQYSLHEMTTGKAAALLANGIIAFGLNVVSFTANKKVGALSITVAANVKQVLTILLAVLIFDLHISSANGLGIFLTLLGGAWYAWVEHREKRQRR